MTETAAHFLELRDVSKNYGGVVALDRVTFACDRGAIHAAQLLAMSLERAQARP